MDDYISREATKEAAWEEFINRLVEDQGMYGYLVHLVNEVFDAIPAADARPVVRGKWISHDFVDMGKGRYTGSVECSACGRFLPIKENFCPNCGADMREEN